MIFDESSLLGIKIHDLTLSKLLLYIKHSIKNNNKTLIYGLCVGSLSRMKNKKRELPRMFQKFDIIVSDGAGIPILGKIFNVKTGEHIPITELSFELIKMADQNGFSVLLFGATEKSNNMAINRLRSKFPNARIFDGINGYFNKNEFNSILRRINELNPDILLLGMTYPFKEKISYFYKDKINAKIILPCGGAIDVFAGITKRPQSYLKKLPLTWLYRWIQETRRLSIKPDIRFIFLDFPILLLKHLTRIERNPSLIKHYKIDINKPVSNLFN